MRRAITAICAVLAAVLAVGCYTAAGASARWSTTDRIVVRPVHANGTPVAGWRVVRQDLQGFTCNAGSSVSAVSPGIEFCGPSAAYTPSCWKSGGHTVLCLRDVLSHTLYRIR